MHMGARRPGIPTRDEVADRESQAWDEMVNAMMEEHIAHYLEGVEARSLASAIAPGSARSRPRSRHDARRPCAGAADDNETQREETREPVKLMKVLY